MVVVAAFQFDDVNIDKLWEHGIVPRQVDDILDSKFVVVPNRTARRARYLLIGRDRSGQCIAVPIEPSYDPVVWRPITAWYCKAVEAVKLT